MTNVELAAVDKRSKKLGQVPFIMGLAVILIAGMVGLLVLSIKIQNGSVELRQAQTQGAALTNEAAALRAEADRVGSVTNLEQQAAGLGMCPNPYGAFVDLGTGKVTGDMKKVTGNELPKLVPSSTDPVPPPVQTKLYPPPATSDGGGD